ncbi:1-phosphofructokinase [Oceanobacillus indicireducens]|uniref:Tagatose-6-phosphate kinase n=1 Tax=Oceanobacillus indicireducens TaxID=1004261 RepID=A0A917Y2G6_9BACI|nr:1-phosphofructokinase [Oceanobacillus indicireducens]GGN64860.1 tagatose-6-phosphate kinase [Oceanobacillus indicireducens]
MIYTVTLNPSIDYIVQLEQVNIGELNYMDGDFKLPGGKGINVSRILHELKMDTKALGFLGGFTGDFIAEWLKRDGIATDFTKIADDTRINIKLKTNPETEINGKGPVIQSEEAEKLMAKLKAISSDDIVILSGSKSPSLPDDFYERIIREIKAQFVIDTTGDDLQKSLAYNPLLVKPNLQELEQLYSVKLTEEQDIIETGKKLIDAGARHAIVSMGADGALLFTEDAVYKGISPKGELKNSVGAGDSMVAGFIGEYVKTKDIVQAFRMGLAAGSATAFSYDLAKADEINALINQTTVTKL